MAWRHRSSVTVRAGIDCVKGRGRARLRTGVVLTAIRMGRRTAAVPVRVLLQALRLAARGRSSPTAPSPSAAAPMQPSGRVTGSHHHWHRCRRRERCVAATKLGRAATFRAYLRSSRRSAHVRWVWRTLVFPMGVLLPVAARRRFAASELVPTSSTDNDLQSFAARLQ